MTPTTCACHVCRPEPLTDPYDLKCVSDVLEHGVHVVYVSEGDDDEPAFAYTVGLPHQVGHPELVMSGQKVELMHSALNEAARRVLSGFRFFPGTTAENVIGRFPVVADAMTSRGLSETVQCSHWFHRRQVEALQLVWPDTRGIFAWQPGAAPFAASLQPQAWRVPSTRAGGVAPDPEWVFPVPADHLAVSCTCVVDEGAPVRLVVRDFDTDDGECWQLMCGQQHQDILQAGRLSHLSHLVRNAPSVRELHDLGLDEQAERESAWAPWVRSPFV